jgi:hypothetical protein
MKKLLFILLVILVSCQGTPVQNNNLTTDTDPQQSGKIEKIEQYVKEHYPDCYKDNDPLSSEKFIYEIKTKSWEYEMEVIIDLREFIDKTLGVLSKESNSHEYIYFNIWETPYEKVSIQHYPSNDEHPVLIYGHYK